MDQCLHAALKQEALKPVTLRCANHVLIEDVSGLRRLGGQRDEIGDARASKELPIAFGVATPSFCPGLEVWKLDAKNGSLEGVHPEIAADRFVVIPPLHAMGAQKFRARREVWIVRRQ